MSHESMLGRTDSHESFMGFNISPIVPMAQL